MPPKRLLRLLPLAEADLEAIWDFTAATWSQQQAEKYHALFLAAFNRLAGGKAKGRPVTLRDGYYKSAVGAHLIFFRMPPGFLDVIRILHSSMDVERHLPLAGKKKDG